MSELDPQQGWQLEEGSAEAYERYLVPLLFAPGAEHLIELAGLGAGERVLDVACGTASWPAAPRRGSAQAEGSSVST
jgi:hypothetical protein